MIWLIRKILAFFLIDDTDKSSMHHKSHKY
ncbi:hypothetical protein LCGC14_1554650 [marine sediment metagenome]|uniref:Uncharacterized protein n=1 Tax=marine sediment metagenome TaxID=412755 RepID=A0A0F9IPA9_9ZZZZ